MDISKFPVQMRIPKYRYLDHLGRWKGAFAGCRGRIMLICTLIMKSKWLSYLVGVGAWGNGKFEWGEWEGVMRMGMRGEGFGSKAGLRQISG